MNKRKLLAIRKHRLTAQKRKARGKGIDPSLDPMWSLGTWEERRARGWRLQRPPTPAPAEEAPERPRRTRTRATS